MKQERAIQTPIPETKKGQNRIIQMFMPKPERRKGAIAQIGAREAKWSSGILSRKHLKKVHGQK